MMIQSPNCEVSDVHIPTSTEITGNSGEHFTRDGERGVVGEVGDAGEGGRKGDLGDAEAEVGSCTRPKMEDEKR